MPTGHVPSRIEAAGSSRILSQRKTTSTRPWIAFVFGAGAARGIDHYFTAASLTDLDAANDTALVEKLLPLRDHRTLALRLGDHAQTHMIEVESDPPVSTSSPSTVRRHLSEAGFDCSAPPVDEEWMYTDVHYATGNTGREQVLGWEDRYDEDTWDIFTEAHRLFLRCVGVRKRLSQKCCTEQ